MNPDQIAGQIYKILVSKRINCLGEGIPERPEIKLEYSADEIFDVIDRQASTICAHGQGGATYHNPNGRKIWVWNYEAFINSLHETLRKGVKRPDIMAWDEGRGKLVINELSTGNPKSKLSDAKLQMHALVHLLGQSELKGWLEMIGEKECIFSCRQALASSPVVKGKGLTDAFNLIYRVLPPRTEIKFQPIQKAGFRAYQTDIVNF